MIDQNPNIILRLSGALVGIWYNTGRSCPEVENINLTEIQDQIPCYPSVSPYWDSGAYDW